MRKYVAVFFAGFVGLALALPAFAVEHSMGKPLVKNGLILHPVYLQPVHMAPMLPGMKQTADVHMEIDIHADKSNPQGFAPGEWVPYINVSYSITKKGSDWTRFGSLMPMVANDGPHYGANVKLDGAGKYHVSFRILPPPYNGFFRHTDKETGVAPWWKPFSVGWDFTYVGVGKKGGY